MDIDDPGYTEMLLRRYEVEFEQQMQTVQVEFEKILYSQGFARKQKTGNSTIFMLSYENNTHQIVLFQFTENRDVIFDIFLGKKNAVLDVRTLNESFWINKNNWICIRCVAYIHSLEFNLIDRAGALSESGTRYLDTYLPRIDWLSKHYDVMVTELENPTLMPH